MFKWDRLLRKNKSSKDIYDKDDESKQRDSDAHSESNLPVEKAVSGDEEEYEVVELEIRPAKIVCPDCGGITLEGLEFCDKCGGEL